MATKNTIKSTKKSNQNNKLDIKRRKINFNILLIFAFCVGLILIMVTYAWFSASLNAKVDFVKLTVNRETGLYASLDGLNYGDEIILNEESISEGIENIYPEHNNIWPSNGLVPVSSNGISSANSSNFEFYNTTFLDYVSADDHRRYLDVSLYEPEAIGHNYYIAFDLFLKNISNTPKSDNLYLYEGTNLYLNDGYEEEMPGLMNSVRFGIVRIGHTPDEDAGPEIVQNIECNSNCSSYIYEPNAYSHSDYSIDKLKKFDIDILNGQYVPTYGIINEGEKLLHESGHGNTPLNPEYFELQGSYTDLTQSLFELPHGITKIRVYIWIEGQDLDSLETTSEGAILNIIMNFYKDLAGYDL